VNAPVLMHCKFMLQSDTWII